MLKKFGSAFLAVLLLSSFRAGAISAKSFALVEGETGRLIYGQNIHTRLPMASTTKIMTGLLACESGRLDDTFTVPASAAGTEGSSMYLTAGERLTLRELTYGLLLVSGNDAANAIACCLDGSVEHFAERMNTRARELGLVDTHYMNPSGLDGSAHYTTALDLARLAAAAMKNGDFAQIVGTYKKQVPGNGAPNGRTLVNHNELLKTYDGAVGVKTGFTKKSGRCLVSCAKRNGVTLVAATLSGHDDWNDHMALLNYGFGVMKRVRLLESRPDIPVPVAGGLSAEVPCRYDSTLEVSLQSVELPRVVMHILLPPFVYAPVAEGQKVGEIVFTLSGAPIAQTDLYASSSVASEKPDRFKSFWKSIF